jgi:hypothetical protein
MALYAVTTGKVTLTASATKSLVLVNPATPAFKVRQLEVSMDASAAAAGVEFDLYRTSTVGSPAGSAATPAQADERDIAAQSTALTALTTEPTAVTVIASYYLQPFGGVLVVPFPYGAEVIGKGGGNRIGVRYVTPSGVTPDCLLNLWWEE